MFKPTTFRPTFQILKKIPLTTSPNLMIFRQLSVLSTQKFIRPTPTISSSLSIPSHIRFYSPLCVDKPAKTYEFEDVQKLSKETTHPGITLVDVREPDEYKEGHIPTAINIPYNSSPGALGLEPEDFEEAFGFSKPAVDQHLVFYCLGGVRSSAAEGIAATYGYQRYVLCRFFASGGRALPGPVARFARC